MPQCAFLHGFVQHEVACTALACLCTSGRAQALIGWKGVGTFWLRNAVINDIVLRRLPGEQASQDGRLSRPQALTVVR